MVKNFELTRIYRDLSLQASKKQLIYFARKLLFVSQASLGFHSTSNFLDPKDEKAQAFARLFMFVIGLHLLHWLRNPPFQLPKKKNLPKQNVPNKWDLQTFEAKYLPMLKYHLLQIWNEIILKELYILPLTVFFFNLMFEFILPKKEKVRTKNLAKLFYKLLIPSKENLRSKKYFAGFILFYIGIVLLFYLTCAEKTKFLCTLECTLKVGGKVKTLYYKGPEIYEL